MGSNNTYIDALEAYLIPKRNHLDDLFTTDFRFYKNGDEYMYKTNPYVPISIVKVIFHDPATIVFWSDESKTVVRCSEGDKYDPEKGLAMAITKKALGNNGNYYNELKKWLAYE